MQVLGYSVTDTNIVLVTPEKTHLVTRSNPNFDEIAALLDDDWATSFSLPLEDLVDIPASINTRTSGKVYVDGDNGKVYYNSVELNNEVTSHLLELLSLGSSAFTAWVKFVEKLMLNPSFRAREQLYGFMKANQITINQDGDLLLYKRVRDDYFDVHTGRTYKYTIGSTHQMARTDVDDDPTRTCSSGIHVAAHSYLASFSGDRVIICAVSPEDVVSIPVDYNNAKMRVSRLRVVAEHTTALNAPTLTKAFIQDDDLDSYDGQQGSNYDDDSTYR